MPDFSFGSPGRNPASKFTELSDTPTTLVAGKYVVVNGPGDGLILVDAPTTSLPSVTANAGKLLAVNAAGDGLEWVAAASSSYPSLTGNTGKVLAVNAAEDGVEWVTGGSGSGTGNLNFVGDWVSPVGTTILDFEDGLIPGAFTTGGTSGTATFTVIDYPDPANGTLKALAIANVGGSQDGSVSFDINIDSLVSMTLNFSVSSESGSDYLRIYKSTGGGALTQLGAYSGTAGTQRQLTLAKADLGTTGVYTISFVYSKDGSVNAGDDRALINSISYDLDGGTITYAVNDVVHSEKVSWRAKVTTPLGKPVEGSDWSALSPAPTGTSDANKIPVTTEAGDGFVLQSIADALPSPSYLATGFASSTPLKTGEWTLANATDASDIYRKNSGIVSILRTSAGDYVECSRPNPVAISADFDFVIKSHVYAVADSYMACGVYIEDATGHKLMGCFLYTGNYGWQTWNGTAYSNEGGTTAPTLFSFPLVGELVYWRIVRSGDSISFYASPNGFAGSENWELVTTQSMTTMSISDVTNIGVYLNAVGIGASVSVGVIATGFDTGIQNEFHYGGLAINRDVVMGDYTLTDADFSGGQVLIINSLSDVTITIPPDLSPSGPLTVLLPLDLITVTYIGGAGVALTAPLPATTQASKDSVVSILPLSADSYHLMGGIG